MICKFRASVLYVLGILLKLKRTQITNPHVKDILFLIVMVDFKSC